MDENRARKVYITPRAQDLSAFGAEGVGPRGMCGNGPYPYNNCANGNGFYATCEPGATVDTSVCNSGMFHTYPTCNTGGVAATLCLSGSHQNF